MQTLYLIDAMALAFRSFFANRGHNLTTSAGTAVSVPYHSALFMHKLLEERQPDYIALVDDTADKTFRHELYPAYKAQRGDMPEGLATQLKLFYELFSCMGIRHLQQSGYEADDIIGTLAVKLANANLRVFIVSQDKDFMQLVNANIMMLNKDFTVVDAEYVQSRFACRPEQIIDLLALMGDSSDNVPGVPRIGEKTASKLLRQYGSLAGIYANLAAIKPDSVSKYLRDGEDLGQVSQQLVQIKTCLPIDLALHEYASPKNIFANRGLYSFYQRLEFRSLLSKFSWVDTADKESPQLQVQSSIEASRVAELANSERCVIFVKADSDDSVKALPKTVVVGDSKGLLQFSDLLKEREHLQTILMSKACLVVFDMKAALKLLWNAGFEVSSNFHDLKIYDYLLNPNDYNHTLDKTLKRYLARSCDIDDSKECCQALLDLEVELSREITARGMQQLAKDIEMPLVRVLALMEKRGVYLDVEYLQSLSKQLASQLDAITKEIYALAGQELNINSPQQLRELLYEKLELHKQLNVRIKKSAKTKHLSTNEAMLVKLSSHPLPAAVLKYRELAKIKNTYIDALPKHVHPTTKRVHTNYQQDVAATGRLSSNNPNLQNIPIRNAFGQKIRAAFTAGRPNHLLIAADYAQIEFRLLAELAVSESLIAAFNADADVHAITAARVLNIPVAEITAEQRAHAKAINFGILYGMGVRKLAQTINSSMTAAQEFMDSYFIAYPEVKIFTESLIAKARKHGFSETPLGRRREIIGIGDSNPAVYAHARNMAVNSCIQGFAADLIKLAMIKVEEALAKEKINATMIMQVHDELVFECAESELEPATNVISTVMENAIDTRVRLKVEIHHGKDLLSTK